MDWLKNLFLGTERVKASKAECKAKKDKAKTDYDAVMKQIEADCEASLTKAKAEDKSAEASQPPATAPNVDDRFSPSFPKNEKQDQNQMGGKRGKSKKRSKSNRKRTRKYK